MYARLLAIVHKNTEIRQLLKCQNYCIQVEVYHTEFLTTDFLNAAMTRVLLLIDRPSYKDVHVTCCIFFIINKKIKTADLWL